MIIVRQGGFEQRDVLEFVDIFFDRLSRECGLGAARFLRGGGQPLFEFLVETNGKHGGAPSLYMYSEGGFSARSAGRSEEHTSELQSLMRNSYAVFCLKKKNMTD